MTFNLLTKTIYQLNLIKYFLDYRTLDYSFYIHKLYVQRII